MWLLKSRGYVIRLVGNTVECFENTMVGGVVVYWVVSERARRIITREYVEKKRRCALLMRLFKILNPGVVGPFVEEYDDPILHHSFFCDKNMYLAFFARPLRCS